MEQIKPIILEVPIVAIAREKILARRKRLDSKQAKLKALQEMIREEERRVANLLQESEAQKFQIVGQIMLERMETDQELKAWFAEEIDRRLAKKRERDLFALNNNL